ncbi:glutaredoxin-C9-like [Hibiscus syriacus]|uniref:glutaredoxin-C9-like n=1 Tax=Hibiscus syriacus TaxID=106335 RepID=UPI0019245E24|nr:glutaredoxin-C9-like [Hibiscus syriacus]
MQEAIPYKSYTPATGSRLSSFHNFFGGIDGDGGVVINNTGKGVTELVSENSVIVFGRRGCCMCHVVKRLLLELGVNPTVYEVVEEKEATVLNELSRIDGIRRDGSIEQLPAVFVGGKLFGGLDKVISTHISGELVPILRDAGALWL